MNMGDGFLKFSFGRASRNGMSAADDQAANFFSEIH
jgi:hypothetical protein